ncbi:regulator [Lysinibacillus contaminans]|uniref:Regulator n=1 Tax=Lysinibacillus contaminans TaxID=1293441 RepID=A0ABR5JX74_9BACI|nr:response regulator transcription factor [Lysinibacillus contaminans]KOS66798.1 regulator [Lysinibacillus contaminans]
MNKILIVDDHPILLDGTKALLQTLSFVQIDTESCADAALEKIRNVEYDLYILDINMEPINGIQLASQIKLIQKGARVILYTGFELINYYSLIIENKIDGLLCKTATKEQVIQTVQASLRGEILLSENFINYLRNNYTLSKSGKGISPSEREIELLNYIAQGYTNKVIACKFGVTQRTVDNYLSRLFSKLKVDSRAAAVLIANENGWLQETDSALR